MAFDGPDGFDAKVLANTLAPLAQGTGTMIAATTAGTRGLGLAGTPALTGTNVAMPINLVYLAAADFAVPGLVAKLRIRAQLTTNAVAPSGNWTFGLHPVSAVAGGVGGITYTIGAAVAGSTAAFTAPAASSRLRAESADFALPADDFYCLGLVTTAAVAVSGYVTFAAELRRRFV